MDSDYLKESIGNAIVEGLSSCVINQPEDPVEYLGRFLQEFHLKQEKSIQVKIDSF